MILHLFTSLLNLTCFVHLTYLIRQRIERLEYIVYLLLEERTSKIATGIPVVDGSYV